MFTSSEECNTAWLTLVFLIPLSQEYHSVSCESILERSSLVSALKKMNVYFGLWVATSRISSMALTPFWNTFAPLRGAVPHLRAPPSSVRTPVRRTKAEENWTKLEIRQKEMEEEKYWFFIASTLPLLSGWSCRG